MLYNSSSCLRTATVTFRLSPLQQAPAWNSSKCLTVQATAKHQARPLCTRLTCTQNSPSQTAPPHIKSLDRSASLPKPSITRFVSTSASPSATANATAASSTTQSSQSLTWDGYLSLRQKRRYYNIIASSLTALASFTGGASFLLTQDIEKISGLMFGLDPFMGMGIVCVGFGATGWLIGPFAGGFVFRLMHRRVAGGMQIKERDLYQRIKKYRCDPTSQSVQNPVPDYYGEKIFSVKGYRQWLKDQRAYRKKRESLTA